MAFKVKPAEDESAIPVTNLKAKPLRSPRKKLREAHGPNLERELNRRLRIKIGGKNG